MIVFVTALIYRCYYLKKKFFTTAKLKRKASSNLKITEK